MNFLNNAIEIFRNGDNIFYKTTVSNVLKNTKTPLVQRNHENRVMSGKVDYLYDPLPQHFNMAVAIYKGENTLYKGIHKINHGDAFLVDGNTRKFFWQAAIEADHPVFKGFLDNNVIISLREFYTPDALNEWYETFDSSRQLKTSSHMMESAAHLSNVLEDRAKNLTYVTSKLLKTEKRKHGETDVDFRARKIQKFGVHHINSFYDKFECLVGKGIYKLTPRLAAYRTLREYTPKSKWDKVDAFFEEFLTGKINTPMNDEGLKSITMYLNNLLMEKGVYSYLCPNNSGNRLPVISSVIHYYGIEFLKGKEFVGRRLYFPNSQVGQDKAANYFTTVMCK